MDSWRSRQTRESETPETLLFSFISHYLLLASLAGHSRRIFGVTSMLCFSGGILESGLRDKQRFVIMHNLLLVRRVSVMQRRDKTFRDEQLLSRPMGSWPVGGPCHIQAPITQKSFLIHERHRKFNVPLAVLLMWLYVSCLRGTLSHSDGENIPHDRVYLIKVKQNKVNKT